MVAVKRSKPDINPQFGFNRIITPQSFTSNIIDLLGTRYVLSLDNIKNSKLKLVFTDGIVKVYQNQLAFSRAFFVSNTLSVNSKQESIDALFNPNNSLKKTAVIENPQNLSKDNWSTGTVSIVNYSDNSVILKTNNNGEGFLVLTDSYYPTWHAKIDKSN